MDRETSLKMIIVNLLSKKYEKEKIDASLAIQIETEMNKLYIDVINRINEQQNGVTFISPHL